MAFKYKTSVLGGTFDHFHKGHQKLLEYGLSTSESLIIGITSDEYIRKSKGKSQKSKVEIQNSKVVEPSTVRKKSIEDYLNQIAKGRFEIVEIDDMFGPTLDEGFGALEIIVSKETRRGAEIINAKRKEKGLPEFEILEVEPVLAEDGSPLSSFRIRNGQIDRDGRLYVKRNWLASDLHLPDNLRKEFQRPWGNFVEDLKAEVSEENLTIAVGDETVKRFNESNIKADVYVFDFKVAREEKFKNIKDLGFEKEEEIIKVNNPQGMLTSNLFKTILRLIKLGQKGLVKIDGEEDLSVAVFILATPLNTSIFYGQPREGMVKVEVSENTKARVREIVAKFPACRQAGKL